MGRISSPADSGPSGIELVTPFGLVVNGPFPLLVNPGSSGFTEITALSRDPLGRIYAARMQAACAANTRR